MSLLSNDKIIFAPLLEGKYPVKLTSFKEMPGKDGKDPYVQLTILFVDGREIHHALFGKSFDITLSHLNQQLFPDNPVSIGALDLLTTASNTDHLNIWVDYYRPDETTAMRNIHFLEPLAKKETTTEVQSDVTAEDF